MAPTDEPQDGYPISPSEETTPYSPPLTLESADFTAEHEHLVTPGGHAPAVAGKTQTFMALGLDADARRRDVNRLR